MREQGQCPPARVRRLCSECSRPLAGELRQCEGCLRARARENVRSRDEFNRACSHVRAVRSGRKRRDWIDRELLREY